MGPAELIDIERASGQLGRGRVPGSHRTTSFWYQSVDMAWARASCRYRIGNLVDHLRGASAIIDAGLPRRVLSDTTTMCCIRPLASRGFERQLRSLRACGVHLVADFDDLLFAGRVSGLPASAGGEGAPRSAAPRPARYTKALTLFDDFTVATEELARRLLALRPTARVSVVPNGLSESWVEHGRVCARPWQPGDELVIRYLCGSPSHDEDFASIAPVLRRFMDDHPAVRLEIFGPLAFDAGLFAPGRVSHRPRLRPFEDLPVILASSWLTIAPLAPTEYNACKSAIKFLESAAFACPTLASPNGDLERHASQGAPVLLCDTPSDWLQALEAMLSSEQRMRCGVASQKYVLQHAMAAYSAQAWRARFATEERS